MATSLHRVRQNFAYQLEQISPTNTIVRRGFLAVDRLMLDPATGNNTGRARDFTISWLGSRRDVDATDSYQRTAEHGFELRVGYPTALGTESLIFDAVTQDRHDIHERLRAQAYYVGYAGATTTAIGLMRRTMMRDYLITDEPVWVCVYEIECLVYETV